jgi:hypothetical protein
LAGILLTNIEREVNMDEFFRNKKVWIGLAALGAIFLCVMLCAVGAFAATAMRSGLAYGGVPLVQPPASGEIVGAPSVCYCPAWHGGLGPFGFLFRMAFFVLGLFLLLGLARRIFWGRRCWARYHGYHHHHHRHPGRFWAGRWEEGQPGKRPPHPGYDPFPWWAWCCGYGDEAPAGEAKDETAGEAGSGTAGQAESDTTGSEYTGPQE